MSVQRFATAALMASVFAVLGYDLAARADQAPAVQAKLIRVSAKRFEFIPRELTLKRGETVDIELSTEDVVMGFNLPDLASRATLIPGQVSHVRLTPQKTGTFAFLCDVFCGSGHEDMNGVITVVD